MTSQSPHVPQEPADVPHRLSAKVKAAGCAAKISSAQLSEIVQGLSVFSDVRMLTSIDTFEDAAVYKISEDVALIQTIDFFPPLVDDPYLFGRIAAANALSDVYAMGGKPILALNVLSFPVCDFPLSVARQVLAGGAATLVEAEAVLAGGHSIQGAETLYGLSVTGTIDPKRILTNGGAHPGDVAVITKPIGSGVQLLAHKAGMLSEQQQTELFASLTLLNRAALRIAQEFELHAATDVTGFGLLGHLHEMAKASGLFVTLYASQVPLFDGATTHAEQGLVPAGAYANRKSYTQVVEVGDDLSVSLADIFFDPQTSGGLLLSLKEAQADLLVAALQQSGIVAAKIARFEKGKPGTVGVQA